jgi:hypothetical protein
MHKFIELLSLFVQHSFLEYESLPWYLLSDVFFFFRYEYKTAALFLRDLELMKSNAIKYNGPESELSKEAIAIYEFAKDTVEQNRSEFDSMEQAVKDQLGGGRKKQKKSSMPSQTSMNNGRMSTANLVVDGISTTVNIGDEGFAGRFGDDSDSDDSD